MTCNSCRPKLKTCPVCSVLLGSIRCLVIEKILEKLPRKCNFHKHGCAEKVVKEERLKHEMICKHLEVSCPEVNCGDFLPKLGLLDHLKEHNIVWKPNKTKFWLELTEDDFIAKPNGQAKTWSPSYIAVDDKNFFYTSVIRDKKKGLWYFWVTLIGSAEEAKRCSSEIVITNESNAKLSFKRPTGSLDETEDELFKKGENILVLPDFVMRQVWTKESKKISLKFKIECGDATADTPDPLEQIRVKPDPFDHDFRTFLLDFQMHRDSCQKCHIKDESLTSDQRPDSEVSSATWTFGGDGSESLQSSKVEVSFEGMTFLCQAANTKDLKFTHFHLVIGGSKARKDQFKAVVTILPKNNTLPLVFSLALRNNVGRVCDDVMKTFVDPNTNTFDVEFYITKG